MECGGLHGGSCIEEISRQATSTFMFDQFKLLRTSSRDTWPYAIESYAPEPSSSVALVKASDANLAVSIWGGIKEGHDARLHCSELFARLHANSQFRIIDIGQDKFIICKQFVDLCLHTVGGSRKGHKNMPKPHPILNTGSFSIRMTTR